MNLVLLFLAGLFLANGVPHFVKGITGQSHMTPFKRVSPAWLNIVWGVINFVAGLWLLRTSAVTFEELISFSAVTFAFLLGVLFIGFADANLFSNPNARLPWHKD